MSSDPISLARDMIDAFNAGDRERFRASLAPDAVEREHATRTTVNGADAAVAHDFAWKEAFPDARGEVTAAIAEGARVALQITWTGTHEGELRGPGGSAVPATGRSVTVPACMVLEVRDGAIASSDHYFDLLTLLGQIGAAPGG